MATYFTAVCSNTRRSLNYPWGCLLTCNSDGMCLNGIVQPEAENSGVKLNGGIFATTHWSVVLAAAQQDSSRAKAALEQLCRDYWYPIYAYVRRRDYSPEDAQDLTQGYFARLLASHSLTAVHPERGRFRYFVLATLKRFLINDQERARAVKRGGTKVHVPFDGREAEERYCLDAGAQNTPDKLFDRAWGLSVMEATAQHLEEEYRLEGKDRLFEQLKLFLAGKETETTYAVAGAELAMSEGAVKVAVHRMRRRYRELLREQVANTVSSAADLENELQNLKAVFYE
jgi:DNA-directed RNA polymerase specialized sigma24 family protein